MSLLKLTAPRMRGDEVLRLQQLLAANGHSPGSADGIFGPATDGAVRGFQQARPRGWVAREEHWNGIRR